MQVGDLVRHKLYHQYFGVITYVDEHRVTFHTASDGLPFSTYIELVETL
jgi:heat shock protein HspQ